MANQAISAAPVAPGVPIQKWATAVVLAWLVPGGGHFFLKRPIRGAILAGSVVVMFTFGLLMRGAMFEWLWTSSEMLTTLIYCGGHIANNAAGIPYYLATWMGYTQPDVAGHVHDYGTKFLAGAGLLNILAMVDAYEIATGEKD